MNLKDLQASAISSMLSIAPLDVVPTVPTGEQILTMKDIEKPILLTYHEGMPPFRPVPFDRYPEALTAKAVIILREYRNGMHRQPKYETSLQPKGVCLSGGIYN